MLRLSVSHSWCLDKLIKKTKTKHHFLQDTECGPYGPNTCLLGSTWRSQGGYCMCVCVCVWLHTVSIMYDLVFIQRNMHTQTHHKSLSLMGKVQTVSSHLSPLIRLLHSDWPCSSFLSCVCVCLCVWISVCSCSGGWGRLTLMMWLWNQAGAQRRLSLHPSKFICYVGSACSRMCRMPLCPCGFTCTLCESTPNSCAKWLVWHGRRH